MPKVSIYVTDPTSNADNEEPQLLNYDLPENTTLKALRDSVAADAKIPDSFGPRTWILTLNDEPLQSSHNDLKLSAAGVPDGAFLAAFPQPNAEPVSRGPLPNDQIEVLRHRLLQDPQLLNHIRQRIPNLNPSDPAGFAADMLAASRQQSQQEAASSSEMQMLNMDLSEENQKKIEEHIRQQRIQQQLEDIMENNPELLGRVHMLYIELHVNNHPVKAFVDSGAQATILSTKCARACGVDNLIDERWGGMAKGVGTAKILGRIHRADVTITYDQINDEKTEGVQSESLPCSFTVMEDSGVDMLLGLDMLKRYQCSVDLKRNRLVFAMGQSVPFLPESQLPQEAKDGQGALTEGGLQNSVGPAAGSSPAAAPPGPSGTSSNFAGAGRALGTAPPQPTPPQQRTLGSPAQHRQQRQQHQHQPNRAVTTAAPAFPEWKIQAVVGVGVTREAALELLRRAGGREEYAAQMAFDEFG